jgi:FixJ family two-component response regulator
MILQSVRSSPTCCGRWASLFGPTPQLSNSSAPNGDVPSCLVLEVRLPDLSGLELQHQLAEAQVALPLIFLTAHGTIPLAVPAMKAGAREFLSKPVNEHAAEDCCLTKLRRFPCSAEPEGVTRPYALCRL